MLAEVTTISESDIIKINKKASINILTWTVNDRKLNNLSNIFFMHFWSLNLYNQ